MELGSLLAAVYFRSLQNCTNDGERFAVVKSNTDDSAGNHVHRVYRQYGTHMTESVGFVVASCANLSERDTNVESDLETLEMVCEGDLSPTTDTDIRFWIDCTLCIAPIMAASVLS